MDASNSSTVRDDALTVVVDADLLLLVELDLTGDGSDDLVDVEPAPRLTLMADVTLLRLSCLWSSVRMSVDHLSTMLST